jgi:hypothetical protein
MKISTPSIEMIEGTLAAQSDTPNTLYESAINQYMRGGLSNRGSSLKTGVINMTHMHISVHPGERERMKKYR